MESLENAHSSELARLPIPKQFIQFSRAYLEAALVLNLRLVNKTDELTYVRGCVPVYLAQHAVELFLKAAILKVSPTDRLDHDTDRLKVRYRELYRDERFGWDIPFGSEPVTGSPEAFAKLAKTKGTAADQLLRYPTDSSGKEWNAISSYIPLAFQATLEKLQKDFDRLESQVV